MFNPKRHAERDQPQRSQRRLGRRSKIRRFIAAACIGLGLALCGWLLAIALTLRSAAAHPVDAVLVLGGSIQREIYVAELAKQQPEIPILISQGSQDPCIWLIFQRAQAPTQEVWLEKCANSTFGNFYFSQPILQRWNTHKVKLITSETHLPRALWLARIMLGAHGIWVELDLAQEEGVPANQESRLKTTLDLTRGVAWAVASQISQPRCQNILPLSEVDLTKWEQTGFKCEHQAGL